MANTMFYIAMRYFLYITTLLILLVFSACVFAESSVPTADIADEGLRRQEQTQNQVLQSLRQDSNVLVPEYLVEKDLFPSKDTQCFDIKKIEILSVDDSELSWIKEEVTKNLEGCIGINSLKNTMEHVNNKLIDNGFVTSKLSLPEQNIKSGKIVFKVYTGIVEGTVFSDDGKNNEATVLESFLLPFNNGDLLNIRAIEQGTENINRLKSQQVKIEIKPGEKSGGSIVVLNRTRMEEKEVRSGITVSNAGNRSVSRTQASAYLTGENIIGVGGIFNVSASSNLEKISNDNFSQSLSAGYNVPVGYAKINISHSYTRFSQVVSGTTARFTSSGSSHSSGLNIGYIIHRNASSKTAISTGVSLRNSKSYLDNVELVVQRRSTVNVNVGASFEKYFKKGRFLELGLSVQQGVSWFGAEDDLIEASQGGGTLRPTLFKANVGFKQAGLLPGWDYNGQLNIQKTKDLILNHDKFSIGSRYTVRGFDGESVLLAESGLYLRNELQRKLESFSGSSIYLALDFGTVDGPSTTQLAGEVLAGAAIGLRVNWKGAHVDGSLGTPVFKPDGFASASFNPYISAFYEF